ncbi:efflux RND transporter periplasmic adaptor subunit [Myxococcota bacterium]|nr:efflux RND transporter periplasmic adaptor subunit [Myxococcota bacterium]
MRAYLFVVALLAAIFVSIGTYKYVQISALANASFERPPVTVAAATATLESWSQYIDAVGTIKAARGINLTSEESGEVIAINFASGDSVESNQLMVVLNDRVEIARRESQRATLELADLQFTRNKELLLKNSVSHSDYDRSKADLDRARADLAETEAILSNKRIRAPFSGVAGIRQVELGDYVSPGTVVATLQDLTELQIDFSLPAQSAPRLRAGQRIELEVDAYPGRIFIAHLMALDSQIDPNTRNLLARAKISEGEGLLPGMFAYLRLYPGSSEDLVTVPETAVTYSLHGNIVYLIEPGPDGGLTATSKVVETGETREGRTSILAGLDARSRVVTAGQNKLYRGVRVAVDEDVVL